MVASFSEFFCLHRRNLLANLVFRNFKVKYRGSSIGYVWTLGIPALQVLVFYFLYQVILKIQIPHYLAYIVTGIFPWVFFATTVSESLESLVSGQALLANLPVPIQVFPAASVVSNFLSFLLSIPIVLAVVAFSDLPITWHCLLFLPLSLLLFVFTYCFAFLLASFYVLFRDLKHMFSILIQLWMYFTPVLYSPEMVPQAFRWTLYVNPMAPYFVMTRDLLIHNRLPAPIVLAAFVAWVVAFYLFANIVRASVGKTLVERL
jgi:ABC-type polysaccharide/polyol phosphate export permease